MKKIPIIVIVGPTASGKTSLSVALAKKLGGEIISADSMQIYKGMHIASAAPDREEKEGIPHHLFEFLDRNESYSVAEYIRDANIKISEVESRGSISILVGGTGLYISSLIDNLKFTEEKTDSKLRERLSDKYDAVGGEKMLTELSKFDPEAAKRIHPNNKKRVIRAFEIYMLTGHTLTEQNEASREEPSPFIPYIIGLKSEAREFIYDRINKRVDLMLKNGLLDEAREAFNTNGSKTSAQAIGHKEFFPFFEGKITKEEAIETLKRETRRYAKRQLTWFSRDSRVMWIDIDCTEDVVGEAISLLERKGYFETTENC